MSALEPRGTRLSRTRTRPPVFGQIVAITCFGATGENEGHALVGQEGGMRVIYALILPPKPSTPEPVFPSVARRWDRWCLVRRRLAEFSRFLDRQ